MKLIMKQEQEVLTRVLRELGSRGGRAAAAAPYQRRVRAPEAAKARAAVRAARKAATHV